MPTIDARVYRAYTGRSNDLRFPDPGLPPRGRDPAGEERRDALTRGEPFENEQRARRNDGEYRWFLIRYNPLHDEAGRVLHWYATGTDIHDRKRDEIRVRSENLALREDIDSSSMFEEIVGPPPP